MLIDWFTVGAQALNFVILAWLMKRFLYKPILNAIDAREKRIAGERADADTRRAEAELERNEFKRKNDDFDRQRAALLSKAVADTQAECQRLIADARQAADTLETKRQEALEIEHQRLSLAVRLRTQEEVFAIARKALAELATASLEERLTEVFIQRLRLMSAPDKEHFARALKTATEPALVRSAFPLPLEQRAALQTALNESFSSPIPVRYETRPDLIGGIELTANGLKMGWSLGDYISSLQDAISELVSARGNRGGAVEPQQTAAPVEKEQ